MGEKVKLREIVSNVDIESTAGDLDVDIQDICYDSRKAGENCLFVAIPGFKVDGHQFIEEAFSRGATAFVIEKEIPVPSGRTVVRVSSTRKTLAQISNIFYDYPSRKLKLVGVTGTNGKTTVTYLLQSIFQQAGGITGRLSTINYDLGGEIISAAVTTPESLELQRFLQRMLSNGVRYAFMEVSSHSLVLHRVDGVQFSWAIFTNLSSEHLDFHCSMDDYLKAKLILFKRMVPEKIALINIDDASSNRIRQETPCRILTYAVQKDADYYGHTIRVENVRTIFQVNIHGRDERFEVYIPGIHNVYNALAAIGVAIEEGISLSAIREGLKRIQSIPGRLERVENKAHLNIYVDYAHTPSALEQVITSLKQMTRGRLIVVFGCGGDRDPYKRPVMGRIAVNKADFLVVTSDNPRGENPERIIRDIEEGMLGEGARKGRDYTIFVDRKEAIAYALHRLRGNDILLVAGKGHEKVQIFKGRVVPFDDRSVIRELLGEADVL